MTIATEINSILVIPFF